MVQLSSLRESSELVSVSREPDRTVPLTAYKSQGFGHILKLGGIVTAGTLLVSAGGSLLFAAPLALATVYGMFRSTGKIRGGDWCESRDEIFSYRLSRKHRAIADEYSGWCQDWGTKTINDLIEPIVGNCAIANFTKDTKHPYHGLRGILVYDSGEDDLPPLCPYDYVAARLQQRLEVFERQQGTNTVDVPATAVADHADQPAPAMTLDGLAQDLADAGRTPTPDQTILDQLRQPEQQSIVTDQEQVCKFLESLTAQPMQPTLIAGLPGMGKGVVTSLALQVGKKLHQLKYWVFDPKSKLEEACYWAGAERHYLKNALMPDPDLFEDLMAVLDEFGAIATERNNNPQPDRPPMILLLEEVTSLIGNFTPKQKNSFKMRIISLAALLRGCNMAIWLSGQSVTLEDLGLTGKSNRNMFNSLVAASGDKAADAKLLAHLLGIEVDVSLLQRGQRYWLTNRGLYGVPALSLEKVFPIVTSWSGSNIIDLRPDEARGEVQFNPLGLEDLKSDFNQSRSESSEKVTSPHGRSRRPKVLLRSRFSSNSSELLSNNSTIPALSEPLDDVARYILSKGGKLPIASLKNWGKTRRKGSLDSAAIDESLIQLMELGLIETFSPPETKAEWIRWAATG